MRFALTHWFQICMVIGVRSMQKFGHFWALRSIAKFANFAKWLVVFQMFAIFLWLFFYLSLSFNHFQLWFWFNFTLTNFSDRNKKQANFLKPIQHVTVLSMTLVEIPASSWAKNLFHHLSHFVHRQTDSEASKKSEIVCVASVDGKNWIQSYIFFLCQVEVNDMIYLRYNIINLVI